MTTAPRPIAIFDFDNTLIRGDSLFPFLSYTVGLPQTLLTLCEAALHTFSEHAENPDKQTKLDVRTFIKAYLLEHLLPGIAPDTLQTGLEKLYRWQKWNNVIRAKLLDHRAEGHHIVIASGGLDLYLPHLLKDTPHDALICTQIDVVNGAVTGHMSMGNCVRKRKAELVAEYLATHGPFGESWGYGNAPHDLPMLELVKHRVLI